MMLCPPQKHPRADGPIEGSKVTEVITRLITLNLLFT
jgi:hypothetical protein